MAQAAVVLRTDDGIERLVAFVVAEPGVAVDGGALRAALREKLPPYMVPAHFEAVGSLPRMVSGKVDRKMLKAAPLTAPSADGEQEPPRNATEAALLDAARRVLGAACLPLEADFFVDLGGHSLLAARFISIVRETPAYAGITLQDVYGARTLRAMAELLDERGIAATEDLSFTPPPFLRRFFCGLAQAVVLPVIIGLATAQWLGVFVTYMILSGEDLPLLGQIGALLGVYIAIILVTGLIAIALKWLVLGRTKPGIYPLWGVYYFRWWFAARVAGLVHIKWLQGTPVMRFYWRLLGAKVGRDVIISDYEAGAIDLIEIGEGTSFGSKTTFANGEAIGDKLVIGRIKIGKDVSAGASVVLGHGSAIGDHAEIGDLTAIPPGAQVGVGEIWDGTPARKIGTVDLAALPPQAEASPARRTLMTAFHILMLIVLPPVSLLPIFPAFWLFDKIDYWIAGWTEISYLWFLPILTWPTAIGLIAFTVLLMAGLRWAILPRVTSGSYSIHSGFYARKWTVALATEVTLETLSSLFATIYMRAWYRLMGASIGKGAEISTNLSGRYDLTGIGAGNFIADEVVFGDEDMRRGYMRLDSTRTGEQVFIGNDAVVPPGAVIPDRVLIGIKSKPPANDRMQPGDTWFGSPPIKLPTRQKVDLGADWTYKPSFGKQFGRGVFEALHTSFPSMLFITFGTIAVDMVLQQKINEGDWLGLVLSFMGVAVAIAVVQALICAAVKWLMMGAYKPVMKPMWSWWAMRTEAVAVMYWGLGGKVLFDYLRGTPFLPWFLTLFGAKYGKGVWLELDGYHRIRLHQGRRFLHGERPFGAADASLRGPGDEGRQGEAGQGRLRRRRRDRALRHPCRRLRPDRLADGDHEGREPAGAYALGGGARGAGEGAGRALSTRFDHRSRQGTKSLRRISRRHPCRITPSATSSASPPLARAMGRRSAASSMAARRASPLTEADIQPDLDRRRPGQSRFTTQRQEPDPVRILSGVLPGRATARS